MERSDWWVSEHLKWSYAEIHYNITVKQIHPQGYVCRWESYFSSCTMFTLVRTIRSIGLFNIGINYGSALFLSQQWDSDPAQYTDLDIEAAKWNPVIINNVVYTWTLPPAHIWHQSGWYIKALPLHTMVVHPRRCLKLIWLDPFSWLRGCEHCAQVTLPWPSCWLCGVWQLPKMCVIYFFLFLTVWYTTKKKKNSVQLQTGKKF